MHSMCNYINLLEGYIYLHNTLIIFCQEMFEYKFVCIISLRKSKEIDTDNVGKLTFEYNHKSDIHL